MNEILTPNEKYIRVYDDVLPLSFRSAAYEFALASNFKIGWSDGVTDAQLSHKYLHSVFSEEDVHRLGILEHVKNSSAASELNNFLLKRAILNLSTPTDTHFVHTHVEDKVLLYYVNPTWNDGWHGETLFYSEDGRDIIFASPYTPGRIIVFQGQVPHAMRPQSCIGDKYRFSLALFFNKC